MGGLPAVELHSCALSRVSADDGHAQTSSVISSSMGRPLTGRNQSSRNQHLLTHPFVRSQNHGT
jgi:hypothetical protein